MSHMTKLSKAQITSVPAFLKACADLGLTEQVKTKTQIADYSRKTYKVECSAKVPGAQYAIGLEKNANGKFDMVSDWWGIRHNLPTPLKHAVTDSLLQDTLLQHTTKHTLIDHYRRLGFMPRVTVKEDRTIQVQLTK